MALNILVRYLVCGGMGTPLIVVDIPRWSLLSTGNQGLSRNASSVSFGHAEHCFFDSLDTQNFMSEFAEDDFS